MDSSYAIWVAGAMLCFFVIESLDVVHGQNTDDASLRALIDEWGDKVPTNWGKRSDPCNPEWEGIQCRNSRVIELKLSSTNLEGNLPADIGGLTELKTLDLSYNKGLSGSLTSSIGELTKLETLILQGCNFDGVIPKELGNLAELYYLALNDNKFIGEMPTEMSKLGKLYWFDITNNKLSGKLPSWLQNLTKAKHFHFGQNQFTGEIPPEIFHPSMTLIHILFEANKLEGGIPDTIKYMDELEVLRLDRNGLTGPVPSITNLTRLNELYLSDNKLTGQLPNLTGLISLKTAYLSNNAFIRAEVPSWLTELTSLTTLAIESGGIQGEFPSKLLENSQLETVKLKNNSFNGSLNLTSTSISSKLKVLDLRENEIDAVIVRPGTTLSFSYSVLGSPFCALTDGSNEACNDLNNTGKGYSTSFTCGIKPCPKNQNLNPRNCECAYAYTGTMELRAPSFSSFTDAERFRSLERSLWEKLDLLKNSVYVEFQNDDPDRSTYNVIKIQLFPSMKISFDRSEISEIGFKLSNQTYKPPPGFSPFTFRGDPYLYFDGVSEKTSNNNIGIIVGIACGCATLVIVIIASIIFVVRKKKRGGRMNDRSLNFEGWGEEKTKDSGPAPQLKGAKSFSFDDLRKYTNDFSVINEIGSGGYGKVYKGLLPNGILVAIKRAVSGSMQGGIEFKNEIELLSRVHHKNLVSLIGFCFDKNEQILVYEYIPNGTLRESLLGKTGIVLDWKRRLKVALGSARGLAYLHDNADPSIIHRDVKSSNILLNGNLSAKVADFGLSKQMPDVELGHVSTQVKGTIGYVDPEYYMTQHLTEKSDVYSFGVVMMELIIGRPPIERGQYIVRRVRQMLNKDDETRGLKYIIDPLIQNTPHLFGFGNFVDLALRCVEEASDHRPNMCEVVREIELILQNNGSNPESGTSLGSDLGAPKDIPHPYNNSMLHRRGNDSSSASYDSSAGFQMAYNVEPK